MRILRTALVLVVALATATPVWAQTAVTAADITRLETGASEIRRQAATLKQTDATLAADVERSLTDLDDEITYLRVKMRREGSVSRDEYTALRDRLETLRVRASGQKVSSAPVTNDTEGGGRVPVGTEFDIRLQTALNSGTAKVEERFEATTMLDYTVNGSIIIPAGSTVRGFVSSVRPAGKLDRRGSLTLSFDEVRVRNQTVRMRASVVQALDPKVTEDVTRIGAGAAVGAILGGIFGGGKGALLGVLVGGGGTMAATEGSDIELPTGTILRIRLDQPLDVLPAR